MSCEQQISWYDNLPLISYALLRGRCRHCQARIPLQYPAVELGTALLVAGCVLAFGLTAEAAIAASPALAGVIDAINGWLSAQVAQVPQDKIRRSMPDTLDMLTVCVEAGLGFDAALAQVVRTTTGPFAAEGARVLQEMQFGRSRVDALRSLADRNTAPELRVFASALIQAAELGVPVGRVLREQAVEMRLRRRQRAEEQAQKVPVKILFPLLFCLFPALFVMVIGPGALSIVHSLMGR